ncbi:hypothetical protein GJ496_005614 [Pomphorhynchus laevis]|nr:hypothetical protein GJ496_005614 [Pomphorhynchus laevis]
MLNLTKILLYRKDDRINVFKNLKSELKTIEFVRILLARNRIKLNITVDEALIHQESILKWSADEIANELTLIDQTCLQSISASEFYNFQWISPLKHKLSPSITLWTSVWERLTSFVIFQVLRPNRVEERAEVICHFIAFYLYKLGNINSIKIIIDALDQPILYRLSQTWRTFKTADSNKHRYCPV